MNSILLKVAWLVATFRKSQVPQYLLDIGNNLVAEAMSEGTRAKVIMCLSRCKSILNAMCKFEWLCPERWRAAYKMTVVAFETFVSACEDCELTMEEIEKCAYSFKIAYAEWCAD